MKYRLLQLLFAVSLLLPLFDSRAAESLGNQLRSSDENVYRQALQQISTNEIPILLEFASDRKGTVADYELSAFNFRAMAGFAKLGTNASTAIPALSKLLEKKEATITAGMCLATIGSNSIPVLTKALGHTNGNVRHIAASSLGLMTTNAATAAPDLVPLLKDSERLVRYSAAEALGKIKANPELVIPQLIKLLDDSQVTVQWSAALALGEFGNLSSNAVPKLLKMAQAKTPYLSEKATIALRKIDARALNLPSNENTSALP